MKIKPGYLIVGVLSVCAQLLIYGLVAVLIFGCHPRYGCPQTSGKDFKVGYHLKK